jgi:adenylate cyclase
VGIRGDGGVALDEFLHPGESRASGATLWRVGRAALVVIIVGINVIGAIVVFALATVVLPSPKIANIGHIRAVNAVAAAAYVAVAAPIGAFIGVRGLFRLRQWLVEDRPATPVEQRVVLRAPLRLFVVQFALWLIASVIFAALNAGHFAWSWAEIMATVALTGMVTASCAYLIIERVLRSSAARALGGGMADERLAVPGVATRAVLAWALGTGVPVAGIVAIGAIQLAAPSEVTADSLGVAMVTLGAIGIAVGLLAVTLAARATATPVDGVRDALARVERGDFTIRVPVYDGTQLGALQLGFNRMAAGLAERERIRAAFGTYVDSDVAAHILEEGTNLAGEEVDVTVLFLDVRDFTGFAERTDPSAVVAALNELFETAVPLVHDHGGRVDKFIGDGFMAVFGAPRRQTDHADRALAAAIDIADAVAGTGRLAIGIGLNSGIVVAGNVGAAGRLEFSVIGDAVNVASRVEAATRQTGDTILLAGDTVSRLHSCPVELEERFEVTLKGKTQAVRLFAPRRPDDNGGRGHVEVGCT